MAGRPDVSALENLRLAQVYNTVVRYMLDMAVDRGPLAGARRRVQYWLHDIPVEPVALGTPTKVRLLLQELGPTYVKVGQLVSSQSHVLPDDWERELARLQQNVAPFPYDDVRRIVTEDLGAPPEDRYERFEKDPLAAASLGQVHRARVGGEEVVVKVRRPGAARRVRADLGMMRNLTRVLERQAGWAREVGLVGVVDEFGKNVLSELDYYGEAYNARRLTRNMQDIPGVSIPRIYPALSSTRVLTMEFVDGVRITSVGRFREAGVDLDALSERFLQAAIKQLLIDGFFHGDPHPGNVLVNPATSTVYMIDLGMCGQLTLQQRFTLIQLLIVARRQDATGMAQVMRGLSTPFRNLDESAYRRDFERRVGRFLDPESNAPISDAMNVGFDVLRENGLRLDPAFTIAVKALMQAEVIVATLRPGGSLLTRGYEIAERLLKNQLTAENVSAAGTHAVESIMLDLVRRASLQGAAQRPSDQAPTAGSARPTSAQAGVPAARERASRADTVLAVLLTGLLVGTGVVAAAPTVPPPWGWVQGVASFCFVAALVVAVVLVLGMLRRLRHDPDDR
jgi:ubiquinone biosynthesis protein